MWRACRRAILGVEVAVWWWMACVAQSPAEPVHVEEAVVSAPAQYAVTGTVLRWKEDGALVVSHDDVPGLMPAMTMPFKVSDASLRERLVAGDRIEAVLIVEGGATLSAVKVVGHEESKPAEVRPAAELVEVGQRWPRMLVPLSSGETLVVGEGQVGPLLVVFVYTRCPLPEFCPMTMSKVAGLQASLPAGSRALGLTLDPDFDSLGVLGKFGEGFGAEPGRFDLGRLDKELLFGAARRAGLKVTSDGVQIEHGTVSLVLGADGTLLARLPDNTWQASEVVGLLGG